MKEPEPESNGDCRRMITGGLASLAALVIASCAGAPAGVSRIGEKPALLGGKAERSLGGLLAQALAGEDADESRRALGRFIERWNTERPGVSEGAVSAEATDGSVHRYKVRFDEGVKGCYPLSYFDEVTPADDFRLKKIPHHRRDGVGAPLVAVRENRHQEPIEAFYPPEAISRPLTAVIGSQTKDGDVVGVEIRLLCPLQNDDITIDGETLPLAADFAVPWAALLARTGELNRDRFFEALRRTPKREPRLFLMEPYDPEKEPLILIHGLFDTPLVWAQLSNELWADESVRERYQIWHYLYNTSAPALYSGRVLRNQLRELRALLDPDSSDPAMKSTTVIAHSMGAIITRSLITRPGDAFWEVAITQPIETLKLSEEDRTALEDAFFWEPEEHVHRVIYVAASHLGSDHADDLVGKLGRFMVRPPGHFTEFYERISSANPGAFTPAYAALGRGELDSVHALSPKQPTLKILAGIPNSHPVVEHSIIADQGKLGPIEESSDGIVEYWSSHLDRAVSEKIIPSGHYAMDHPDTVAEIKRILTLP